VHLLRYVAKCTDTNSPFNIQASCSKCPPSAWIPFLTRVTTELVTLRSTAVLNRCELDPCVYDIFDSESALELNPEEVSLNSWDILYIRIVCLNYYLSCVAVKTHAPY